LGWDLVGEVVSCSAVVGFESELELISNGSAAEGGASGIVEDVEKESEPGAFWVGSGERSIREVSNVVLRDGWVILYELNGDATGQE